MKIDKKLIYVTIFSFSWAIRILFNKMALNTGIEPMVFTVQSVLCSTILLTIYAISTKRKEFKRIDKNVFKKFILIGLLMGISYITGIYGLRLSTSINYSFLIKSTIVFTTLLAVIFLKEDINKGKVLLLITFILGAYLVTTGGKLIIPKVGDLLIIATAFCLSSSVITQKTLSGKIKPEIMAWANRFFAFLVLILLIPIMGIKPFDSFSLLFVVIVGTLSAVTIIYLNKLLSVSTASYATMMSMIVPVINSILGIFILKEHMNIFQIIGGMMIIISGILTQKKNI
ncbi:MAG: EamA family transporter [Candidatus Aenigmarchaeota archaeon]|nr:EamA family transporter [Candidatus Aenigmarchaeota archaeon]